jgi:hypothetical protein
MTSQIEWNGDGTRFRGVVYDGDEPVDVTPWLVPAPTPLTPVQQRNRRIVFMVVVVGLQTVVLFM